MPVVESLEESRIREVANEGMGREGVLKFWFGESDEVTPGFIREAAMASLHAGETFYAHNLGLPELRHAIAGYTHTCTRSRPPTTGSTASPSPPAASTA
jgi:aspartate/methionine/tyrosine aminotransferase